MNPRARADAASLVPILVGLWVISGSAIGQKNLAFNNLTKDVAGLPRVLIIGDSISKGHTQQVREGLAEIANVHRVQGDTGRTDMDIARMDVYLVPKLGSSDIIHFNSGLGGLCCVNLDCKTQGNRDKVGGTIAHTPEQYLGNLDKVVGQLKATGAETIFATTTPVSEEEAGRRLGDDKISSAIPIKLMETRGIRVNDLHSVMVGSMKKLAKGPGDVHFTDERSRKLANAVITAIPSTIVPKQ